MPQTYDHALMIVNTLQDHLAGLARAVVDMLADKKISPWEGLALSMRAMTLGTTIMTMLQSLDAQTRADILTVLEQGDWVMPPGMHDPIPPA